MKREMKNSMRLICNANYVIEGKAQELDRLYQLMKEQEEQPCTENNQWGNTWLGNLVMALGKDPKEYFCKGKWTDLHRGDGTLSMSIEIEWAPAYVMMALLKVTFPSFRIYYKAEQLCERIYEKNDVRGKYFPEKEKDGETYHITNEKYCRKMALVILLLMQNQYTFDFPSKKDWR